MSLRLSATCTTVGCPAEGETRVYVTVGRPDPSTLRRWLACTVCREARRLTELDDV